MFALVVALLGFLLGRHIGLPLRFHRWCHIDRMGDISLWFCEILRYAQNDSIAEFESLALVIAWLVLPYSLPLRVLPL